jgi:hypothetical protein
MFVDEIKALAEEEGIHMLLNQPVINGSDRRLSQDNIGNMMAMSNAP